MENPKPTVNPEKCTGCGACIDTCPMNLFKISKGKATVIKGECLGCKACESVCLAKAIKVKFIEESIK